MMLGFQVLSLTYEQAHVGLDLLPQTLLYLLYLFFGKFPAGIEFGNDRSIQKDCHNLCHIFRNTV